MTKHPPSAGVCVFGAALPTAPGQWPIDRLLQPIAASLRRIHDGVFRARWSHRRVIRWPDRRTNRINRRVTQQVVLTVAIVDMRLGKDDLHRARRRFRFRWFWRQWWQIRYVHRQAAGWRCFDLLALAASAGTIRQAKAAIGSRTAVNRGAGRMYCTATACCAQ